ncbi:hypothetical protein TSAR_000396 [Trichomalopsis sarcophagae]|uniref:Low molecular weight phosphotyrosine protein phosphatase n=1 Tax=Trichomalopsis sarcophagae TaxID=543379 RepID=A0A232FDK2_9HYME|nr:hypothetical protein TSAR_000396 [Trichomalopsis sarcophagae]
MYIKLSFHRIFTFKIPLRWEREGLCCIRYTFILLRFITEFSTPRNMIITGAYRRIGNICRSPIAEAVFAEIVKEKGLEDDWEVDSAALIGYHTGKNPDRRAMEVLKAKGIKDYSHKARTLESNDYTKFDWIFGMDEDNLEELERKKPQRCKATIELLGKHDPDGKLIIRDPYYDNNSAGFYEVYEQCDRSIRAFLQKHS